MILPHCSRRLLLNSCRPAVFHFSSTNVQPARSQDLYQTLEFQSNNRNLISDDDIKRKFYELAKKHHPDVKQEGRGEEEKFKRIAEAYAVLGDPKKREEYDTL